MSPGHLRISVAMTTFNGARFVSEQLDSIFNQSSPPFELIVCDDGSTDETLAILQAYAARSPLPMHVIANRERLGSTRNFEQAVRRCTGEIIVLSDQDDVWCPNKLATLGERFSADHDIGAIMTNADLIDDNGEPLSGNLWERCWFTPARQAVLKGPDPFDLLLGLPVATGATMAFRSRYLPLLLPFPAICKKFLHDRWIAVAIAAVSRIAAVPDKLIAYRLHREQQTGTGRPLMLRVFAPHPCSEEATVLAALEERLAGDRTWSVDENFRRALRSRQRHVAERATFSRNPLRRLTQVAVECASGRYVRYPYGSFIPLQDLLAGTR